MRLYHYLRFEQIQPDGSTHEIQRVVKGDLDDPWFRQECHLFVDEMMRELRKAEQVAE